MLSGAGRYGIMGLDDEKDPASTRSELHVTSNRRDFLRTLGSRVIREAREIGEAAAPSLRAMSDLGDVFADNSVSDDFDVSHFGEPLPVRQDARAPERCLELEELCELAHAEELEPRLAEIRRLARPSVRLTPDAPDPGQTEAWLDLDAGLEILQTGGPVASGPEFVPLAQIALSADALRETSLAGSGWLVVSVERAPTQSPDVADALRARVQRHEHPMTFGSTMEPMRLGAQLQLPRVWSDPVQELELEPDEHYAYIRMRDQLSERQGVEVERDGGADLAYHRLLGWPDETSEAMPADCVAAAGDGDWRLLVQLSVGAAERVYVWVADDDYERAVAFIR
jgi:hypothetical protein